MAKKLDIGGELHSVATDHKVADASEIKDISKGNKSQTAFNNDVDRHEVEIHGIGGIDSRLTDVEQLGQIALDGGKAQIAQGSDFTNPDATKRAKIPTVGAIVDGLNDGIYDISKRNSTGGPNNDGKFTLEYILNNANTLIPTSWRHGGMTISFIQSSDNKYVQFRYIGTEVTGTPNPFLDTANWQGVDDESINGSHNLIESGGVAKSFQNIGYREYTAIGQGNTGVLVPFNVLKDRQFVISLPQLWDFSSVTYAGLLFTIGYKDMIGNNVDVIQVAVNKPSALKKQYTLTFDQDFQSCYVFFRGNNGTKMVFDVVYSDMQTTLSDNITFIATNNNNIKANLPNINTTTNILDLGYEPILIIGSEYYAFKDLFPNNSEYYRQIPIYDEDNASGAVKLLFNFSTNRIYTKYYGYTMNDNEIVIGAFRLVYSTHIFLAATLPFEYTVDGNILSDTDTQNILIKGIENKRLYYGETIRLNNMFDLINLFSLSDYGSYSNNVDSQGMDIYDNRYLFQGNSPSDTSQNNICVIDLANKTILGGFSYNSNSHINNINCGEKYTDSDVYPILYISNCYYDKGCDVIRVANDLSGYTLLQNIQYIGTSYMGGVAAADWSISHNFIYHYTTNNDTGITTILKFNKPALNDGAQIRFTDNDILDVFTFNDSYIYQGCKVMNEKMYFVFGYGNTQYPSYIKVFDTAREEIVTNVPLDSVGEIEAVAYYNGSLLIVNNATNPMYRLLYFQ